MPPEVYSKSRIRFSPFIAPTVSVHDNARALDRSRIFGRCTISDQARMYDRAAMYGHTHLMGHAIIRDDAMMLDTAIASDNAYIHGNAIICGSACIQGMAIIGGDGLIRRSSDYITIGPAISSERFTTAHVDCKIGIRVNTGCFSGSVKEFQDAIWEKHHELYRDQEAYAQYMGFVELIKFHFSLR